MFHQKELVFIAIILLKGLEDPRNLTGVVTGPIPVFYFTYGHPSYGPEDRSGDGGVKLFRRDEEWTNRYYFV